MASEKNFENKIKRYLESKNCWYVKFFANAYTKAGIPDLLCCVNGYFLAIEVKAENGRPSDLQKLNVDRIRRCGGKAIILRPSQFDDFTKLVEALNNENRPIINLDGTTLRRLYGLKEV